MDLGLRLTLRTTLAMGVLLLATIGTGCPELRDATDANDPGPAPASASATPAPAVTFESTVRPILATKCAPCHNPGGKMYASLPFDQPAIISSHADGVRRRLKGEDLAALEKWLATLPPAAPNFESRS
jgi:cytochrome c553